MNQFPAFMLASTYPVTVFGPFDHADIIDIQLHESEKEFFEIGVRITVQIIPDFQLFFPV